MKKLLFLIYVLFLMCSFVNISCAQREGLAVGDKAPDFSLEDVAGNKVNLQETVKTSKKTLLVFWATWCPHCRNEIPELRRLNAEYRAGGLKILAVNIGETQKKVDSFIKQQGITYTALLDTDNRVASQYGVMGIPTNILLDSSGVIKYRGVPPPPEELLQRK